MPDITFKGNNYSKLYEEMAKIKVTREEKIIPKVKISNSMQEIYSNVKDAFISNAKIHNNSLLLREKIAFSIIAGLFVSGILLCGAIIKYSINNKDKFENFDIKSKKIDANYQNFKEKVNTYYMQLDNNEITLEEFDKKFTEAKKEHRENEHKIFCNCEN